MGFKLKSKIASFIIAIALLSITALAVVSYADWQDGKTAKTIVWGQSADFDVALFSETSLTYSIKMYNSSDALIKTWYNNEADSDGWVETSITVSASDIPASGDYDIIITSTDGNGDSGYSTLNLAVTNNAPTIDYTYAPASANAGDTVSIGFTASDADGNSLTYSIYIDNVLVSSTNAYDWSTATSDIGTHTIRFEVTDGDKSDTRTATIKVVSEEEVIPPEIIEKAKETLAFDRDLEISETEGFIKIRNTKGNAMDNFEIIITYIGVNLPSEIYKFDLGKNAVVLKPIASDIPENNIYVAKIEISVDELEDSGYLLINN